MLRLALILHLFIGSTLAGIGVVVALTIRQDTLYPILGWAAAGFILSIPVTYFVARALYQEE